MTPYVVNLPAAICARDYWLLGILLSDGTELIAVFSEGRSRNARVSRSAS
jgi:hypothetical protein